jgi:glycosyltransferase involved in cell wall biosynthesis
MKISVVIIAHNEETWIKSCLESLLAQSTKPDETILVLHNCTDRTKDIAQGFPIKIIECFESGGPIVSRIAGIEASSGDIICCSDGDCWLDKNWVKNISRPLIDDSNISIVGGYTKIQNSLFWKFSCWWQFVWNRKILNNKNTKFAWGSNLSFRKSDYLKVGGLRPFLKIHKDLKINYWAEDLYLSLALQKVGKIFFAINANVYTYLPKEKSSPSSQIEIVKKQKEDNKKLFSFFKI